jgi:hypothetical protein
MTLAGTLWARHIWTFGASADRSCQGTQGLPYWTYDLTGKDWTATFVVVDSDCFLSSYQLVVDFVACKPMTTNGWQIF